MISISKFHFALLVQSEGARSAPQLLLIDASEDHVAQHRRAAPVRPSPPPARAQQFSTLPHVGTAILYLARYERAAPAGPQPPTTRDCPLTSPPAFNRSVPRFIRPLPPIPALPTRVELVQRGYPSSTRDCARDHSHSALRVAIDRAGLSRPLPPRPWALPPTTADNTSHINTGPRRRADGRLAHHVPVRGSVQSLKKLADSSGALLFRGWHLDTIEDYERVDALGLTPTSFFGQAPRKPAGRLLARNVAFEAAKSGSLYEALKTRVGVVWAPMYNEMAYLDPEHHLAEYLLPSRSAGTRLLPTQRDGGCMETLMPIAMKWVFTRRRAPIKATGSTMGLEGVEDQWSGQIVDRANELNIGVEETEHLVEVGSRRSARFVMRSRRAAHYMVGEWQPARHAYSLRRRRYCRAPCDLTSSRGRIGSRPASCKRATCSYSNQVVSHETPSSCVLQEGPRLGGGGRPRQHRYRRPRVYGEVLDTVAHIFTMAVNLVNLGLLSLVFARRGRGAAGETGQTRRATAPALVSDPKFLVKGDLGSAERRILAYRPSAAG